MFSLSIHFQHFNILFIIQTEVADTVTFSSNAFFLYLLNLDRITTEITNWKRGYLTKIQASVLEPQGILPICRSL